MTTPNPVANEFQRLSNQAMGNSASHAEDATTHSQRHLEKRDAERASEKAAKRPVSDGNATR